MAVDSISLLAQNSYTKIQEQQKQPEQVSQVQEAKQFQAVVEKQFNSFAKMSPAQILSHIQKSQQTTQNNHAAASNSVAGTFAKNLHNSLRKQEEVTRKSLINEASLLDVLTATTEAKNTLEVMVKTRDKFMEAFDKVMNMPV